MFTLITDTGGGNALNVQRTIKDLIAAGAAGCFLEVFTCNFIGIDRGKVNVPSVLPAELTRLAISRGFVMLWDT